jgi:hypothetical protein
MQIPSLSMRTGNPCQAGRPKKRDENLIYKQAQKRAKDANLNFIGHHSWNE